MRSNAPRPLARFLRPFTTYVFNPISRPFVKRLPGFGIISYRGRTSGRTHRTPMNVFRDGEDWVFALIYGSDVQSVKNVLTAGEAELEVGNRTIQLTQPHVFVDPSRVSCRCRCVFLGLIRVSEFLRMRPTAGSTVSTDGVG